MLFFAWMLGVVGLVVAYVISLAGAMSTVPQLHWRDALAGVPLPLVTAALALWSLAAPRSGPRPWVAAGVPLALACLALLLMAVSYFDQPGGPM